MQHITDDLYKVNIDDISIASPTESSEYTFSNPRNWKKGKIGLGFEKDSMSNLAHSIATIGLLHPLVINDKAMLIAGERRYRTLRKLIKDNVMVYNPVTKQQEPAGQVYQNILCKVCKDINDLKALELAFSENDPRVEIGDGATFHVLKRLRDLKMSDKDILNFMKKPMSWLRQMDKIMLLDEKTLDAFLSGQITSSVAYQLYEVENIANRHEILSQAIQFANERFKATLEKLTASLSQFKERLSIAELEKSMVEKTHRPELIQEATEKVNQAKQSVLNKQEMIQQLKSSVSNRDLLNVNNKTNKKFLSPKKISEFLKFVQESNSPNKAVVEIVLNSIISGETDFQTTLDNINSIMLK